MSPAGTPDCPAPLLLCDDESTYKSCVWRWPYSEWLVLVGRYTWLYRMQRVWKRESKVCRAG